MFTEEAASQSQALVVRIEELERYFGKLALQNEILRKASPSWTSLELSAYCPTEMFDSYSRSFGNSRPLQNISHICALILGALSRLR